jgi:hypothetical protein
MEQLLDMDWTPISAPTRNCFGNPRRNMQSRNRNRSLKLDRATSDESPNPRALSSPQSDKNLELTKLEPDRELTRVDPEAGQQNETLKQFRSRLTRGEKRHGNGLYRRFILQAAQANCDFFGQEAQTFDHVSAALEGLAPGDTVEAMLSVQIWAVHEQAMNYLRLAAHREQTTDAQELCVNLATRLMRTFAALTEALARHRSKGGRR